jgi:hypothetical protein
LPLKNEERFQMKNMFNNANAGVMVRDAELNIGMGTIGVASSEHPGWIAFG